MKTKGLSNAQAKQQQSIFVIRSYRLNKVWWIYLADSRLCTPHSSMHTVAVCDTSMPMLICIVVNDSIHQRIPIAIHSTVQYMHLSAKMCNEQTYRMKIENSDHSQSKFYTIFCKTEAKLSSVAQSKKNMPTIVRHQFFSLRPLLCSTHSISFIS